MSLLRKLFWPIVVLGPLALIGLALLITASPTLRQLFEVTQPPIPTTNTRWTALPIPVQQHTSWTHYTNSSEIRDLVAADGLIWAATSGGVAVWNIAEEEGATTKFTTIHGLASNDTTTITIDAAGHLWVGTSNEGVSRYDGANWIRYTTANGLASNQIQSIALDRDGSLLVGTPAGLSRYRPVDDQWQTVQRSFLSLEIHNVRDLFVGPEGVWTATDRGVELLRDGEWTRYTILQGLPSEDVRAVTRTAGGLVWAATAEGLAVYEGGAWRPFDTSHGLLSINVQTVSPAADGRAVWVGYGTGRAGITQFSLETATPAAEHIIEVNSRLIIDSAAITLSNTDTLWVGTTTGLFQQTTDASWHAVDTPSNLPSHQLSDLFVAHGALWGRSSAGLTVYDGVHWFTQTTADGLASDTPTDIITDPNGQIWVTYGTPNAGFHRLFTPEGSWEFNQCTSNAHGRTFASSIHEILFTDSGIGWLIAHDGVFRITPITTETGPAVTCEFFGHSQYSQPRAAAVSGDEVLIVTGRHVWRITADGLEAIEQWRDQAGQFRTIVTAPDGAFWLASDRQLIRYDGREWLAFPLPVQSFAAEVRDLAVDDNLTLWLATSTGLGFYDGAWQQLTTADGLPSNDVHEVLLAPDGAVWVVTGGGVGQYYPN